MDILKALKGEESKLLRKAQAIRAAINTLGGNSSAVERNGRRAQTGGVGFDAGASVMRTCQYRGVEKLWETCERRCDSILYARR